MAQENQRIGRRVVAGAGALVVLLVVLFAFVMVPGEDGGLDDDGSSTPSPSDAGGSTTTPDEQEPGDVAAGPAAQPTAVEPPTPGATEPIEKPPSTAEANFEEAVTVAEDLVVELVSLEAVEAGRDIPGEVSGPAVKVVIVVENCGDEPVDTSGASLNLTYGGDSLIPAPEVLDDASSALTATIPPGGMGEGTYLFAVPLDSDGNVRIMVDVLASEPDVVFSGPSP